jgi:hypothetical protein
MKATAAYTLIVLLWGTAVDIFRWEEKEEAGHIQNCAKRIGSKYHLGNYVP